MQFPQVRMESQQARITIQQTPAQMEIRQPEAAMDLRQPKADMQIRTTKGRLNIDQSKAFAETNLKSALRWTEDMAAKGKADVHTGTARRAQQGNQLLDIHLGGNAIAEQAIQNGQPSDKMLGIKYMPSPFSVKIHYEPAEVDINVQGNKPRLNVQKHDPQINAHRGGVAVNLAQKPDLKIEVD